MRKQFLIAFLIINLSVLAQGGTERNVITTAVPFLSIDAQAQSTGMGWIGVVSSDLYKQGGFNQNAALLAQGDRGFGFYANYCPWLRNLVPDIHLYDAEMYLGITENQTLALSARYFDLGQVLFTDGSGNPISTSRPFESSFSLKYAQKIGKQLSIGIGLKYIHSELATGNTQSGTEIEAGRALAADLGINYNKTLIDLDESKLVWRLGFSIVDLGSKISYVEGFESFLPQNLKLGTMLSWTWTTAFDYLLEFDFAYQADKLLVPSPPIYRLDDMGNRISNGSGGFVIDRGMDPDVSSIQGAFQSFYDAPGGAQEEWREIIHHIGLETRVLGAENKLLAAIRAGYFHEHFSKGDRKFLSTGMAVGYSGICLDVSRIFTNGNNNLLEDTWVIGISTQFKLNRENPFVFK